MKKFLLALCAAVALLALAACDNQTATADSLVRGVEYPEAVGFDDYEAKYAIREANQITDSFANAFDDFAYQTASSLLNDNADTNVNYSPLSLYYALAVAASGAEGQTQQELLDLLGVADADTLAEQCGNLYRLLYTDNEVSQLKIATSLWLDNEVNGQEITFKDSFLDGATSNFYVSAYSVDFAEQAAGEAMAAWVTENTNGMLTPQITTDAEQLLSILNTVYFYDQWIDRFDASETAADTFYLADSSSVECDFMNQTFASSSYVRGNNYTRSQLALKNSGSMIFVLPDEGVDVASLVSSPDVLQEVLTGGEGVSGEVIWQIPKFSFGFSANLADMLHSLGINAAFNTDADFSGITDAMAFISGINQETHIAIDENGVEASAFTQIDYAGAAMPEGRAEMILNRPFIYAVTASNGMILFVGICNNPVA